MVQKCKKRYHPLYTPGDQGIASEKEKSEKKVPQRGQFLKEKNAFKGGKRKRLIGRKGEHRPYLRRGKGRQHKQYLLIQTCWKTLTASGAEKRKNL